MRRPETAGAGAGDGHAVSGAANWLCLAAAQTFAIMALLSGNQTNMLCGASAWNGMTVMYALMSAFHLAPWLKLITRKETT